MVCAPVRSIIPELKLEDYLSIQVHKPCSTSHISITCKVYPGYHGTSEIEHGLCACKVDNPLAKARGLSLRTGAQTMLYLSLFYSASETKEEGVDRRRGGKTILQTRAAKNRTKWKSCCCNDLARVGDRID